MIVLPKTASIPGFVLTQVHRSGNVAIFEQRDKALGHVMAYEVVRVKVRKPNPAWGETEDRETYPSPASWGHDAFTYLSLAAAHRRAQEMAS